MRSSGVLLPISSLPSPYGIGSLGADARAFIDFLEAAGQRYWQILPIGPVAFDGSPYKSFSAFAGNPYLIDLDTLAEQGLLEPGEIQSVRWGDSADRVDYGYLNRDRFRLLHLAAGRMDPDSADFRAFSTAEQDWLDDYALFMAIKVQNQMAPLQSWPAPIRSRQPEALAEARQTLSSEILFWKQVQFQFYQQWRSLRKYGQDKGIEIIGDIPIYVSPDSSDLWADPELFQTDENLSLAEVAGTPPDAFATGGQRWGNPLYNWQKHRENGFCWWLRRLQHAGQIFDVVRIDHFRGLESYYSFPAAEDGASGGRWNPGPGRAFFAAVKHALPDLRVIAEDLGTVTPEVAQLRDESGFPGMNVLQLAFDSREPWDYMPHHCIRNQVIYTGTHDNPTAEEWQRSARPADVQFAKDYLDVWRPEDFTWRFIRMAAGTVTDTCIIPLQDYLCLGAEARINTPGTPTGNWQWRVRKEMLTEELAARIRHVTCLYGRLAGEKERSCAVADGHVDEGGGGGERDRLGEWHSV